MASECSVLKAIVHPHIIALHEIFNTPKQLALVLEYAR
jgi:serine/threonine protein kinase